MPCYQVNLISQKFQAKHLDILEASAKALGMYFQVSDNIVRINEMYIDLTRDIISGTNLDNINLLKRTYTEQGMKKFAKKYGWQTQKKTENQYILQKF